MPSYTAPFGVPAPRPVSPQEIENMKRQYQESGIRMFDRGALAQSDPIGFQASLATPDSSIRPFQTGPSGMNGIMFPTNIPGNKLTPQMQQIISQMGATPQSVAGKIGIGPNTDQFTIEHELTHKGMDMMGLQNMQPRGLPPIDQETAVRLHGALRGQPADMALLEQTYGKHGAAVLIEKYKPELIRLQQKAAADNRAKMPWLGQAPLGIPPQGR